MTRISKNAFATLAVWMIGFGMIIGLVFPFAVMGAGVSSATALSPGFFAFTIAAGVVVGGVNILLARVLVRPRLTLMARSMERVEVELNEATQTGDWSNCDPAECAIPVDSTDEFGIVATAFNRVLLALAESHNVETRLSDFTDAMSADLDVEAICQAAIDHFRSDLGAAAVAIIGVGDVDLEVLASHGLTDPESLIRTDLVKRAVRSATADSMKVPNRLVIDAAVVTLTPEQVDVYPLVVNGTSIGAVVLARSEQAPIGARALASVFIRTLSVALSNARSHESIQRIASLDPLTGMYNRRAGLRRLQELFARLSHRQQPLAVLMADIDHFKAVNDSFGHLAGDSVLRAVTGAVRRGLRSDDVLVRYGGEELLIILPGADFEAASAIAERVRSGVENQPIQVGGDEVRVTISIGVASTTAVAVGDEMALVGLADDALYSAKRAGRNQVMEARAA